MFALTDRIDKRTTTFNSKDIYIQAAAGGPVIRISSDDKGQMTISCTYGGVLSPWSVDGLPAFKVVAKEQQQKASKTRYFRKFGDMENPILYRVTDRHVQWRNISKPSEEDWMASNTPAGVLFADLEYYECAQDGSSL